MTKSQEYDSDTKKYMHYAKLHKDKLAARLHLQLCRIYSNIEKYKDAFTHARLAITHSHNFIMESSSLCKILTQTQKNEGKGIVLQPVSDVFPYTTLNRLHTFNMIEELNFNDLNIDPNKAFYFGDNVRMLDKLLIQYNGILKELMKKITDIEKHLNKSSEDIIEFANSLSPKATSVMPETRTVRRAKIKQRNCIGLKSVDDYIYTITIDDIVSLIPLTIDNIIPNFNNSSLEITRDSIYEKISLLGISYYLYGIEWKILYDKTKLENRMAEAIYWNRAAVDICRIFLPSNSPISELIFKDRVETPSKSPNKKTLKENGSSEKPSKVRKTPLTSPSKEEKGKGRKFHAVGNRWRKRPFAQQSHNVTQVKVLTKYLQ